MIQLRVVTPMGEYMDQSVKSIHVKSVEGEMTILPNHMPIVASLLPCRLRIKTETDKDRDYSISGGFLHFSDNKALLLTDAVEGKGDIDLRRAQDAYKRARERLDKKDTHTNMKRAELSLQRAINRIHVHDQ